MESSNIHHHQHQHQHQLHQDQIAGSSSLATTPCYGVGSSSNTDWIPNSVLNTHGFRSYPSETVLNPRQQENTLLSSQYSSIAPDNLGFHWGSATGSFFNNHSKQDLQLSRIKEEQSNGNVMNKMEVFPGNLYSSNGAPNNGRGFSQIFPSIHVSNLNPYSLDMNLHALDLPTSSRLCGNFSPCSENRSEVSRDGFCYGGLDHMQHQTHHMSLYSSNKISASSNGFVETKRTSSNMEPKAIQTVSKKSRLQARVSCPPFKVRKEKLGDRIAALQQLVAPFGKTDTASVLMEAIGYIKFLQNQVETLSVPYMKTSQNKTSAVIKWGSAETDSQESKRDLKSRGLCLVPLSCLSYITDGGGAVWPPPHFGGAT